MRARPWRAWIAATVVAGSVAGCGGGGKQHPATSTTRAASTTAHGTSTSSAPTTAPASTTRPADAQPATAVWPFASGDVRFRDPVTAARSFATTYLGFTSPTLGPFAQGDSRSGEVDVRPTPSGPVTTVFVRQLTRDDTWWVLGAANAHLDLQSPPALAAVSSPVTLSGRSTAFEATVNVEIRQDGTLEPLQADIVMGGSMGEMAPFSKSIAFPAPVADAGAVVLRTLSARDGTTEEASVVRVRFAG
ncbi:MAG: Gmad2 immunoglobulin-like domain-containing protein [Acidimicrobiia bacterium]